MVCRHEIVKENQEKIKEDVIKLTLFCSLLHYYYDCALLTFLLSNCAVNCQIFLCNIQRNDKVKQVHVCMWLEF